MTRHQRQDNHSSSNKMSLSTRRWGYPPCYLLLVLSHALAFFQPHAGLVALSRAGARGGVGGGHAATWQTSTSVASTSGGSAAATARRRPGQQRSSAVAALQGKKRKNRKEKVSNDSSSWYDEEGDHSADAGALAGGAAAAAAAAASTAATAAAAAAAAAATAAAAETTAAGTAATTPLPPSPNLQRKPEIGNASKLNSAVLNSKTTSTSTSNSANPIITDDALLRPVASTNSDGDTIDSNDDGVDGKVIIEPVWVEGETQGEKPIVETYGLDALAAEENGIDIDVGGAGYDDANNVIISGEGGVGEAAGLVGGVGPESWRNGMEVPDDDFVLGEGLKMERGLDDMLMERSIRFYDPKLTGERERCYLVGLEASGWGMGGKKGTKGSYPEARLANEPGQEDGDDGWDDEQEAEYQERKQVAYEARKEEREMRFSLEESMAELSELAGTAGLEVAGSTYQRVLEPNPRTYIGTGKVKEIKSAMTQLSVCTVIFDDELSPGQQRSLEVEFGGEAAGIKVLDRTALILDIFAQHARTREGQLQVELALHMYRLPRLTKLWTHLERQQGGVGLRGPGERQLEVDRRLLKDKIIALKKELGGVRKHRDFQRRSRRKLGLPVIALVGYTNAGKSTLLNTLTRAGVMAENMLFATLDPTTRKVKLTGLKVHPEVMLTDTVGFIQKLPTNLVAAFRATLEEVVEADVIVHIVDVSSPSREKQESAVTGVLGEMGVLNKPRLTLWNKLDLLPEEEQEQVMDIAEARDELTVSASAKTGEGLDGFVTCLEEAICTLLFNVEAVVPYSRGDLLSRVHELGACDTEEYTDAGTYIKARVPTEIVNRLEPYFTPEFRATMEGEERKEFGDEEAAARGVENKWKLIAKKRIKADAIDEQVPAAS